MRRKDTQPIKEIIGELINHNQKLNNGLMHNRLIQNWQTVMGPTIAKSTKNVFLGKGGILFVTLSSSVVRNELSMLKDRIITSLNNSVGEEIVKDIVFK